MWALVNIETQKHLQDRALLFWSLLLPIGFIILFMAIFTNMIPGEREAIVTQVITGFTVFFSVFIIISIVFSFLKDRERGLVARYASTPLTPVDYFLGKWFPFVIMVVAQLTILTLLGIIVYDMRIDNIAMYFIIVVSLAVMISSWGVAISVFSTSENFGIVMTQIIAMSGAILGGLWFPFDMLPTFIQVIGKFLPQYWAHQGFIEAVSHSGNENILVVIIILLGYTIIGFVLAIFGYRRFLRTARN